MFRLGCWRYMEMRFIGNGDTPEQIIQLEATCTRRQTRCSRIVSKGVSK